MGKFTFQQRVIAGFAICLFLVFILASISYISIRKLQEDTGLVNHTYTVISQTQKLENYMITCESEIRGYVASGDLNNLLLYENTKSKIIPSLVELRNLAIDQSIKLHVDTLSQYAERKIARMEKIVEAREKSFEESSQLIKGGNLSDTIRSRIDAIVQRENILLAEREAKSSSSANQTILVNFIGCLLILGLVLLLLNFIRQSFREQKLIEERVLLANSRAERAQLIKQNFLANMSHEIRTPLNGIMGLSKLLHQTDLNYEQLDIVNLLSSSAKSLLGIVNDILDISKIEAGNFKIVRRETDIHKLITSVINLAKFETDERNIEIEAIIYPEVPQFILADSLRLNQILMNLVSNAVKFTNKGKVTVQLKELQRRNANTQLQIDVIDTGIGIAPESVHKVFESFEQAEENTSQKFGGTGLGLSIVKKLVELKGGTISIQSEINKGSTFTFTNWYQIIENPSNISAEVPVGDLTKFENLSVLVAEDNEINQFVIEKILRNWNIHVEIVGDGTIVLQKLKEKVYDLILMDTQMPLMDGLEATRHIRANFNEPVRSIPIISLSASVMEDEQRKAIDAGVNNVLSKPFDPTILHGMIAKMMAER